MLTWNLIEIGLNEITQRKITLGLGNLFEIRSNSYGIWNVNEQNINGKARIDETGILKTRSIIGSTYPIF